MFKYVQFRLADGLVAEDFLNIYRNKIVVLGKKYFEIRKTVKNLKYPRYTAHSLVKYRQFKGDVYELRFVPYGEESLKIPHDMGEVIWSLNTDEEII